MDCRRAVALYRLANKYGIDYLRKEVLKRLKVDYPSSLNAWDRSFTLERAVFHSEKDDDLSLLTNLAYEYDIQIVLPAMYLTLSRIDNETLLRMRKDDGLNPQVLETCLVGKEQLFCSMQRYFLSLPSTLDLEAGRKCTHEAHWACNNSMSAVILDLMAVICDDAGGGRSLDPLSHLPRYRGKTCSNCSPKFKEIHQALRQELWNNLPSFFGLPKWTEITDQ
ncbi:hypothetical protein CPC08DRAFT_638635 [Agrocybe pediades]|nr:hypothetical protein CPC08DRAFT_638635 [Agrocybe pediades]